MLFLVKRIDKDNSKNYEIRVTHVEDLKDKFDHNFLLEKSEMLLDFKHISDENKLYLITNRNKTEEYLEIYEFNKKENAYIKRIYTNKR